MRRIMAFLDPWQYRSDVGYQISETDTGAERIEFIRHDDEVGPYQVVENPYLDDYAHRESGLSRRWRRMPPFSERRRLTCQYRR